MEREIITMAEQTAFIGAGVALFAIALVLVILAVKLWRGQIPL